MMRYLLLVFVLSIFTSFVIAKSDSHLNFKYFNSQLNSEIETVIKNNPQDYETKPIIKRKPASVNPINEESTEGVSKEIEVGHSEL